MRRFSCLDVEDIAEYISVRYVLVAHLCFCKIVASTDYFGKPFILMCSWMQLSSKLLWNNEDDKNFRNWKFYIFYVTV